MRQLRGSRFLLAIAAAVALVWVWALWPRPTVLRITFLDVRQGDCAFLRTPGGKTILIDAGGAGESSNGFDVGARVVVPFLRRQGVRKLDVAVMTHPHEDHIGGMPAVLKSVGARTVIDSGQECSNADYRRALGMVNADGCRYCVVRRGQTVTMPDGVRMEILNPDDSASDPDDESSVNDHSVVLRLVYRHAAVLFTADAGEEAERSMVDGCVDIQSDVLKVGHHGSSGASSEIWLRAVKPRVAVISVGRRNGFGHPSESTVQRLVDSGAQVFRTDRDGAVTVTTDGESLHVSATRR